jgi:hypothetical protein
VLAHIPLYPTGFASQAALRATLLQGYSLLWSLYGPMTESPFARWALPHHPRSYGLMRQTSSLCDPLLRSGSRSLQVAASPCWPEVFPDVISAIRVWVLGPLPRSARVVPLLVTSHTTPASPERAQVRRANHRRTATATAGTFRGCSHSVMFRLPYSLDPQVAPTAEATASGRPGLIHHASLGWLPAPRGGIATCPTRAIDTAGLPPAGLQPCRPLRSPTFPRSPCDAMPRSPTPVGSGTPRLCPSRTAAFRSAPRRRLSLGLLLRLSSCPRLYTFRGSITRPGVLLPPASYSPCGACTRRSLLPCWLGSG